MQGSRPLFVVVDTTAFRADMRLGSAAWQQTLALSGRGVLQLHIPTVVIRETVRHYERETDRAAREIRKGFGPLRRLGVDIDSKYQEEIEKKAAWATDEYEPWIRAKLGAAGANIIPLPKIAHSDLLDWDLRGRKPFNVNGKGYRDALIWASIVELCAALTALDTLIIVTDNSDDFCGADKTTIAQELVEDLPTGVLVLRYPNLKSMLIEHAWPTEAGPTPTLAPDSPFMELLKEAVASACDHLIGNEVEDPYSPDEFRRGLDFDFGDSPLPRGLETITVESVDPDFDALDWEVYDTLDDGTLLAKVYIDAAVILDGFMHHADYYASEDDVEVHDPDWNEHYAWVYVERNVRLTFNTVIDGDLTSISEVEFDSASALLPHTEGGDGPDATSPS